MSTRALCLLLSVGLASGCTTTHTLSAKGLTQLDGFDAATEQGRERELVDDDGSSFTFTPNSTLQLSLAEGALEAASFLRIEARPNVFRGTLTDGRVVTVAGMGRIVGAEVSEVSAGKSVGAFLVGLGVAALVAGAVVVVLGMVALSSFHGFGSGFH
jgi:hypothetical protein